jgi:beta-phosphoglucomutase-like phosphatase (HAD superfamily)
MDHFGLPRHTPEALKPHLGWGVGHLMRSILPDLTEAQVETILAHYRPYYAAHATDKSRPFEGILPMMERLRDAGLVLAILSNKPDAAVQPLARQYFSGVVSLAVGELEGVRRKPHPDMVQAAAARLGVPGIQVITADVVESLDWLPQPNAVFVACRDFEVTVCVESGIVKREVDDGRSHGTEEFEVAAVEVLAILLHVPDNVESENLRRTRQLGNCILVLE